MNHQLWSEHLAGRIHDLEHELALAREQARHQRRKREDWELRALYWRRQADYWRCVRTGAEPNRHTITTGRLPRR